MYTLYLWTSGFCFSAGNKR